MQQVACALHELVLMSNNGCKKQQENRHVAGLVELEKVDFVVGDFNFDLSKEHGKGYLADELLGSEARDGHELSGHVFAT